MKKLVALLLVLVMVLSMFTACSSSKEPAAEEPAAEEPAAEEPAAEEPAAEEPAAEEPAAEEPAEEAGVKHTSSKDSITVSLGGSVTTLDPVSTNLAVNQMLGNVCMSTLVDFDEDWNVIPNVAESWKISEDGLTYTFTLRDDVYFHSGDKCTAEDVVFSVDRCINSSFTQTDWMYCDGAEALSENQVALHLNTAYTPFICIIAKTLFIHNQSYYEEYLAAGHTDEEYQMDLDGTGPYKFVEYNDGVSIEFEAFEDYFKGEAPIKHWYGKIITDDNAREIAIESGEIDLIETHTSVPASNLPLLQQADGVVVETTNFEKVGSIPINTEIEPFNNKLVRQAMAYAIDYDWLIEVATNGEGYPTECAYLGHKTTGFSTADTITHYTYDVEKAQDLLEEAGYPNGEGIPTVVATIAENRKTIMEVVQECWAAIGINLEFNMKESGVVLTEVRAGNFTVGVVFNNCMVDASMYNTYYFEESIGASNMARYVNQDLIDKMAVAAQELDPDVRQAEFDEIWSIITDEVPAIWLYYEASKLIYAEGLHVSSTYPTQSVVRYEDMYWE